MKNLFQDTTLSYVDTHYSKTTVRVNDLTILNELKDSANGKDKLSLPALCSFNSGKKTKDSYNQSNICFVDIDTTEFTDYIINNSEEVFQALPFILTIQKSFSGKIHLICKTPLSYSLLEFSKYSISAYECVSLFLNKKFNRELTIGFGRDKEGNHYELDLNCIKATQLIYVSNNDFIFNDNVKLDINYFNKESLFYKFEYDINKYCDIKSGDKNSLTVKYGDTDKSIQMNKRKKMSPLSSNIHNFQLDTDINLPVKYLNRQLHLNYNITRLQLDDIIDNTINLIKANKQHCGRLLLRPHIKYEGIVDVKMYFYTKKDKNNNTIRFKQGKGRRNHLLRWSKQVILNAIATYNHNGRYDYMYKDIAYTIYWLYYECISINGKSRNILDRIIISILKDVKNNWDNIEVEYKTNRYVARPEIEIYNFDDLRRYWEVLKQARYKAIEDTFSDMTVTLSLKGKKYKEIASILNENNVEAKTKYGWSIKAVFNMMEKLGFDNKCEYENRLEELYSEGKKYVEIASILNIEGYTTKQGKEFNKENIKKIVSRNLK